MGLIVISCWFSARGTISKTFVVGVTKCIRMMLWIYCHPSPLVITEPSLTAFIDVHSVEPRTAWITMVGRSPGEDLGICFNYLLRPYRDGWHRGWNKLHYRGLSRFFNDLIAIAWFAIWLPQGHDAGIPDLGRAYYDSDSLTISPFLTFEQHAHASISLLRSLFIIFTRLLIWNARCTDRVVCLPITVYYMPCTSNVARSIDFNGNLLMT